MRERLLLDGVDAKTGRASVAGELDGTVLCFAHEAEAALPVVKATVAGAHVALHPPFGERLSERTADDTGRELHAILHAS